MADYDVIVIGAGHNGLAAAADFTKAGEMVGQRLVEKKDLGSDDFLIGAVNSYMSSEESSIEAKKALFGALAGQKHEDLECPKWTTQIALWRGELFPKPVQEKIEKPENGNTLP